MAAKKKAANKKAAKKKATKKAIRKTTKKATKKATKKVGAKRTTHRSTGGSKLYAKRGGAGEFEDIQTYRRAHGSDVKRVSKAEVAARGKSGAPTRKTAKKK